MNWEKCMEVEERRESASEQIKLWEGIPHKLFLDMLRLKLNFISWCTLLSLVIRFKRVHMQRMRKRMCMRKRKRKKYNNCNLLSRCLWFSLRKIANPISSTCWLLCYGRSRARIAWHIKIATHTHYTMLLTTFIFTSNLAENYFNIHCLFFNCTLSLILTRAHFFGFFNSM